jgi:hypothetical protein
MTRFIGTEPQDMLESDEIWIAKGWEHTVDIEAYGFSKVAGSLGEFQPPDRSFHVVASAYVYGIMDGELSVKFDT